MTNITLTLALVDDLGGVMNYREALKEAMVAVGMKFKLIEDLPEHYTISLAEIMREFDEGFNDIIACEWNHLETVVWTENYIYIFNECNCRSMYCTGIKRHPHREA